MEDKRRSKDGVGNSVFFGKTPIKSRTFTGRFTQVEVRDIVEKMRTKYAKYQYTMEVCVDVPGIGFRSGKWFKFDEDIMFPSTYNEWETTSQFIVYGYSTVEEPPKKTGTVVREPEPVAEPDEPVVVPKTIGKKKQIVKNGKRMGDSEKNDCLFECFNQLLGYYNMPQHYKYAADMKALCGVGLYDKIPMNKLPLIEATYRVYINITGDAEYHTHVNPKQTRHTLNLEMYDEHVSVAKNNNKKTTMLSTDRILDYFSWIVHIEENIYAPFDC